MLFQGIWPFSSYRENDEDSALKRELRCHLAKLTKNHPLQLQVVSFCLDSWDGAVLNLTVVNVPSFSDITTAVGFKEQ